MTEIKSFIYKNTFSTLAGCILTVEACTECLKYLAPEINGLWGSFILSCLVALIRFILLEKVNKEAIILSIVNIAPIFLGSIGIYQIAIKPIEKLLS